MVSGRITLITLIILIITFIALIPLVINPITLIITLIITLQVVASPNLNCAPTSAAVAVIVDSVLGPPNQPPKLPLRHSPLLSLSPSVRVSLTSVMTLMILMTPSSSSAVMTKLPVQLLLHL